MSLLDKFRKHKGVVNYKREILENLCDLLNTKRGYGSYPKDLGLDSYIYLGTDKKIILQMTADIKTCFKKYENRIQEIEVVPIPNESPFFISFDIKCHINDSPYSLRLSFNHKQNLYSLEDQE